MQIHELNNYSGALGSGSFLAIDNGTDTGKISSQQLLAATEARIDNIIAGPAPSAEEIVDARLGADGVTYPSLGDAIRDQFTDVKADFNLTEGIELENKVFGKYLVTNGSTIDYTDVRTAGDANFGYAIFNCSEGDVFTLNVTGGNSNRAWAFADSSANILSKSDGNVTLTNRVMVAPASSAKLIIHGFANQVSFKGRIASKVFNQLESQMDSMSEAMRISPYLLYFQFLKQASFASGYYDYNPNADTVDVVAHADYKHQMVYIPKGTYCYKNLYGAFCWLRRLDTNQAVSFKTLNGNVATNSSGTFTIDYPAIFYATGGAWLSINMLSTGALPTSQVEGWYSFYADSLRRVVYCTPADGFYASLESAMETENSVLIVGDGTYDLVTELGSSYFTNFDHDVDGWGKYIGNGVEVICGEGAVITCNYTGTNQDVHKYFSPLNALREATDNNDFIIRNMNIIAKNCRYIVHDECAVVTIPYRHIYDSCVMHLDNSESLSDLYTRQSIGGGLGYHGYIKIVDSVFSCDGGWDGVDIVSYHNSSANIAKSKIVFTGNYIGGQGRARFSSYGTQETYQTIVLANNNSLGANISTRKETEESGNNMTVYQWNNEVRS